MERIRTHGTPPYKVAVVHGGPGAGGEMAPVARQLARHRGVLEPIQTATSLDGQTKELQTVLESHGDPPIVLVGFSWGAWLSFILAARYPAIVEKLILVGSGPFEEKYVAQLRETRMRRLSEEEREAFDAAVAALENPATADKDAHLAQLGALVRQTDVYDPVESRTAEADRIGPSGDVFHAVWQEASGLRRRGELLALGRKIECPVIAIHGEYDPHPAEGVRKPLALVLERFRFVLLEHCGHKPWIERQARAPFFGVLEEAVSRAFSLRS
jgi:pimeloyl-ACP methyl ester carboxylesterase